MLRTLSLTIVAVLALPLAVAQASSPSGNLYLQDIDRGVLKGSKLVLRGVSERTVQFSDRPERRGGTIPTRRFVRQWKSDFRGDPPNAALEVANAPRGRDVALLVLRRPRYNARTDTLVYRVRHLKGVEGNRLPALERRGDHRAVTRFGRATLFIDPGAPRAALGVFVHVPAGQEVSLQLGNSSFDYDVGANIISGIRTAPVNNNGISEISTGLLVTRPTSMMFQASNGGGGLSVQLFAFVEVPASNELTGTAKIPSGGSLQFVLVGGKSKTIHNGPFTLPIQAEE